jgi:HEAT repeat protein
MNRRIITSLSLAALVVIAAGAISVFLSWWIQPRYKGVTLNKWLERLDGGHSMLVSEALQRGPWLDTLSPERRQAADAVRAIGPRALPRLVQMLKSSHTPRQLVWQHPALIFKTGVFPDFDRIQKMRALYALAALGPAAESAIPDVVAAMRDPFVDLQASWTLAYLGPAGREALRRGIVGNDSQVALLCIESVAVNRVVSPEIQSALLSKVALDSDSKKLRPLPDDLVQTAALGTLGLAGVDVPTRVSCSIAALSATNSALRYLGARILESLGPIASNAVPALKVCLTDEVLQVRTKAADALRRISPGLIETIDIKERRPKSLFEADHKSYP